MTFGKKWGFLLIIETCVGFVKYFRRKVLFGCGLLKNGKNNEDGLV